MDLDLKNKLIKIVKEKQSMDPSHDIFHVLRVLRSAEKIAEKEGADMDVVIVAALFHDVISYEKNDPRNLYATKESAQFARSILLKIGTFEEEKVGKICRCIELCSFSNGIVADFLEAKVLQDADRLEATGAISICRTFASSGRMNRKFFSAIDPFCISRVPDDKEFGLDLFFTRLLVVGNRMHTKTAKNMARSRGRFLKIFLKQLEEEI